MYESYNLRFRAPFAFIFRSLSYLLFVCLFSSNIVHENEEIAFRVWFFFLSSSVHFFSSTIARIKISNLFQQIGKEFSFDFCMTQKIKIYNRIPEHFFSLVWRYRRRRRVFLSSIDKWRISTESKNGCNSEKSNRITSKKIYGMKKIRHWEKNCISGFSSWITFQRKIAQLLAENEHS